jgi:hypothetical protein
LFCCNQTVLLGGPYRCRSVVHVGGGVNNSWQFANADLEALLNLVKGCSVLVSAHERDRETLSAESAGTSNSMKVGVGVTWHVEVEDDVDLLNIDTAAKKLGSDQDTVAELLEALVDLQSNKNARSSRQSVRISNLGALKSLTCLRGASWSELPWRGWRSCSAPR